MLTASMLFSPDNGENRCYYCGAECGDKYFVKNYVNDTFTNRDIVKFPGSEFICAGCAAASGAGEDEIALIDGSIKKRENARGMQPRLFSWILTKDKKLAATKAHLSYLRDIVLNPPDPPFSIILSDTGQKQLIFRAPVSFSKEIFPVMLEDRVIEVNPIILKERLELALPVVAAIGKPALLEDVTMSIFIRYSEYHGNTEGLEKWLEVQNQPISRLAAWLSKSKEDAQYEYPGIKRSGVSPETGRACGSEPAVTGTGDESIEGGSGQILFDLGDPVR